MDHLFRFAALMHSRRDICTTLAPQADQTAAADFERLPAFQSRRVSLSVLI
jgi:hypothetical protein